MTLILYNALNSIPQKVTHLQYDSAVALLDRSTESYFLTKIIRLLKMDSQHV